jgi:dihydrofolate reductase
MKNECLVSIIVAMDEKRGIGRGNDLLFRIKGDARRLREKTMGHALVMGRNTFVSLGRKLPNRSHIVVTRDASKLEELHYKPDAVAGSVEEGIEIGMKMENERLGVNDAGEVFVFGGGQIYKDALEKGLVDRLYLTKVAGDYGADTFFPEYPEFRKVIFEEEHEEGGYKYSFLDLEKGD